MEGELALLETAWRQAEEIAKIADNLLIPPSVDDFLERNQTQRVMPAKSARSASASHGRARSWYRYGPRSCRCDRAESSRALVHAGATTIRFGTASWTDPTLDRTGRLLSGSRNDAPKNDCSYYSSLFSVVEVDSSYYALPTRRVAELWVERTPDDFVFDVKAFGWMTGHATETVRLPRVLQDALPNEVAEKKRLYAKDVPQRDSR